ncbi:hypothetical protein [Parasphingopyxis sp.]|uniref:hypothetical protein n=1 Tax=Parasphingopyxis sp. TaxID=1920299 RepID=UPI00260B7578|nr:hypothetical protein [Parasphingopyxis sp.]
MTEKRNREILAAAYERHGLPVEENVLRESSPITLEAMAEARTDALNFTDEQIERAKLAAINCDSYSVSVIVDAVLSALREPVDEIERKVAEWHDSDSVHPLHKYLGLTWDAYVEWATSAARAEQEQSA